MITSLRLVNFKNFADETLKVGPFTVIVGANASGKSNIRDAFRFLHGIGRGYTLAEILGGKYGPAGQLEWMGIRGAPNEVARLSAFPSQVPLPSWFSLNAEMDLGEAKSSYKIGVMFSPGGPDGFTVSGEELKTGLTTVYNTINTNDPSFWLNIGDGQGQVGFSRSQPALSQIYSNYKELWYQYIAENGIWRGLETMRFLELSPARMREPSIPGPAILGDRGENLPSVLEAICGDSERQRTLTSWLQELTPMDVKDFDFPRDPSGRVHLHIVERDGRKGLADSASDGTLRFLGMLAALLGPTAGGLYFFEEIENGIHPARLSLLIDLLERQTAKGQIQVVATTHSPGVLDLLNDETFENTSVVYRDEDSADAVIRPVAKLPKARELRNSQGLGHLLGAGWMEDVLAFAAVEDEEGESNQ